MKLVTLEWLKKQMEEVWVEKEPSLGGVADPRYLDPTIGWKFGVLVELTEPKSYPGYVATTRIFKHRMYGAWKHTTPETREADRNRLDELLLDVKQSLMDGRFDEVERFQLIEGVPADEWKPESDAITLARNVEAAHVRDPQSHRSEPVCLYCRGAWPCAPQQIAAALIEAKGTK